jgi:Zn finger protein HypA/HybF involved in hydrogenase expression
MIDLPATIKSAGDLLGRAKEAVVGHEVSTQIAEFLPIVYEAQRAAIDAQQREATLVKQVATLEAKIAELEKWAARAEQYELKTVGTGTTAYVPKESVGAETPPHMLCTNCFHNGKQSILQATGKVINGGYAHRCPSCQTEIGVGHAPTRKPIQTRSRRSPWLDRG